LGDNMGECAVRVPRSHRPLGRVECHHPFRHNPDVQGDKTQ